MTGLHQGAVPSGQPPTGVTAAAYLHDTAARSPGLPEGIWRDHFIELAIEVHRRDLTPADERVLRYYAGHTRPKDWSVPGAGPVCYACQRNAAETLNLDRKSVYNAETKLEVLGLAAKLTLPNGHRLGPRGSCHVSEALGIAFYPAILAYDALAARAKAARAAREAFERDRRGLMAVRARLARTLRTCHPGDPMTDAIRTSFEALPRRLSRIADPGRIPELTAAFQDLLDDLRTHLSDRQSVVDNSHPVSPGDPKIPHARGPGSPHHTYSTTNTSLVPCTSRAAEQTDASASDTSSVDPAIAGEEENDAPEHLPVNSESRTTARAPASVNWQIRDLIAACGPDFQAYLDLFKPNRARVGSQHIVDAAAELAAALGIDHSAWREACAELGMFDAALAVLILDANRDHPERPVRNPGGALRGVVRKHRAGALNLDASMFALMRRRSGTIPVRPDSRTTSCCGT